jgi:hypothetical protein
MLTVGDSLNPGVSYLLVLCRSLLTPIRQCLIFNSQSSKFLMSVSGTKVIKHIDLRNPKEIVLVYFDKSCNEMEGMTSQDE